MKAPKSVTQLRNLGVDVIKVTAYEVHGRLMREADLIPLLEGVRKDLQAKIAQTSSAVGSTGYVLHTSPPVLPNAATIGLAGTSPMVAAAAEEDDGTCPRCNHVKGPETKMAPEGLCMCGCHRAHQDLRTKAIVNAKTKVIL